MKGVGEGRTGFPDFESPAASAETVLLSTCCDFRSLISDFKSATSVFKLSIELSKEATVVLTSGPDAKAISPPGPAFSSRVSPFACRRQVHVGMWGGAGCVVGGMCDFF